MGVASVEFLETGGVVAAKIPPNMPARAKACLRAAAYPGMIASWVNDVWPLPSLYWWGWFHQFPFEELVELLYRGTQTMRSKSRWLAGWLSAAGFGLLGLSMARSEYLFVAIDLNRSYTQLQIAGGGAAGGGLGGGLGGGDGGAGMGGPGMGGPSMGGAMGRGGGMGGPSMGGAMGRGGGMGGPSMGGGMGSMGAGMGAMGGGMGGPSMGGGMGSMGAGMGAMGGGMGAGTGAMPAPVATPDYLFAVVELNNPTTDNKLLTFNLPGLNVRRLISNRGEALVIQHEGSPMAFERLVDDTRIAMPPISQRLINYKSNISNRKKCRSGRG